MPGSVTYDASGDPVPLGRPSALILAYRYTPSDGATRAGWDLLPNVRVLGVTVREGADPGAARLRYAFADPYADAGDPTRFPEVFPLDASGPRVLNNDDRVVIVAVRDDSYYEVIFDGFAQVPQLDLGPETEAVSVLVVGTPVREWDRKLPGAVYRDADDPAGADGEESLAATDLPVRFNPDGKPNASAVTTEDGETAGDAGEAPNTYPVFLGPFDPDNTVNGADVRPWTLAMAARYLVVNGTADWDGLGTPSPYVEIDDLTFLDEILQAIAPAGGDDAGVIDLDDDTTFTYEDIIVQDVDCTGMAWPEALARLIEPHGFGFRFVLEEKVPASDGVPGEPTWTFTVWRRDQVLDAKPLNLQALGGTLDPAKTNLQGLGLQRDTHGLANRIVVDAAPIRYEQSFILMPGYSPAVGDLANLGHFIEGSDEFTGDNVNKYRLYVFDECGEGHWRFSAGAFSAPGEHAGDLTDMPFPKGADGLQVYTRRRRPATHGGHLLSTDALGKPLRAALFVTFGYAASTMSDPKVWSGVFKDGSGNPLWQQVTSGSWRLLEDRLGFYITATDPNSWFIGDPDPADTNPNATSKISMVDLNANWSANAGLTPPKNPPLFLLVCCVDGDDDFNVAADRRAASPTRFTVERRVDCRDRFRKDVVCKQSWFADDLDFLENDVAVRDDTKEAQALADGQRRATEAGVFGGTAVIPRFVTGYFVGDKITAINGRNVSLQTNLTGGGESPQYPSVVGITWEFESGQSTALELSDRRDEPPPRRGRRGK